MATLDELVEIGILHPVRMTPRPKEFEDRKMYATADFKSWMNGPVKSAVAFLESDIEPRYQARDLLRLYLMGGPFSYGVEFKRLRPNKSDTFELRSPDLRFFGWFVRKDVFIAVVGDTFENLKEDENLYEVGKLSLYDKYMAQCVEFRIKLDLDEPKYIEGAGEYDVISN